jgi:hypothetical protein
MTTDGMKVISLDADSGTGKQNGNSGGMQQQSNLG